jgi:hypothetical protein
MAVTAGASYSIYLASLHVASRWRDADERGRIVLQDAQAPSGWIPRRLTRLLKENADAIAKALGPFLATILIPLVEDILR